MTEHALIEDSELQERVRRRYARETAALQRLGFQLLGFLLETEGAYSAIWQLPTLLFMLAGREVLSFSRPLRLGVATALLRRSDPSTVALCMGKGVKLYTGFSDQTMVISSTFRSYAVPRPTSKIIKPSPSASIEAVWPAHSEYVARLEAEGRSIQPTGTFDEFVQLTKREEDLSQYQ